MNRIGNRKDVMNGLAKKTSGGLKKRDLKYNKNGKIVSKKMSKIAKKRNNLNIKKGGVSALTFENLQTGISGLNNSKKERIKKEINEIKNINSLRKLKLKKIEGSIPNHNLENYFNKYKNNKLIKRSINEGIHVPLSSNGVIMKKL